jgi:hypothetical protein
MLLQWYVLSVVPVDTHIDWYWLTRNSCMFLTFQYGLSPMMKDLGVKLQKELKPGSYILSNVFAIPGWKPIANKSTVQGTHIYRTPTCWSK